MEHFNNFSLTTPKLLLFLNHRQDVKIGLRNREEIQSFPSALTRAQNSQSIKGRKS